jgi:hypothetical protein
LNPPEPDAEPDLRLSYLLYAASLAAFYFVPFVGTLSLSDLSWAALRSIAWRPFYLPAAVVLLTPFLFTALAWGLGSRRGLRRGFAGLCRELACFVLIQAALLVVLTRGIRGDDGRRFAAAWMFVCFCQLVYAAVRCIRLMHVSFGVPAPSAIFGLFTLSVWLFESALFVGASRTALLHAVYPPAGRRAPDYASRVLPEPGGGGRDDASSDYHWARLRRARLNSTLFARGREDLRGDWKDPGGDWATALRKNRAALASFRAAAGRADCDLRDPVKEVEWYGDPAPDSSYIVELTLLTLIDARRAEAQGRVSDAAADYSVAVLTARHMLQQRRTQDASAYARLAAGIVEAVWTPLSHFLEKDLGSAAADAKILAALRRLDDDRPEPGFAAVADLRRWFASRHRQLAAEAAASPFRSGLLAGALATRDAEAWRAEQAFVAGVRGEPAALARYLDDLRARHRWLYTDSDSLSEDKPDYCGHHPGSLGDCWGFTDARWASNFMAAALNDRLAVARTRVLAAAAAARVLEKTGRPAPPTPLMDPFGGGPLRYSVDQRGRWKVYSIGPDRKDDKAESLFAAGQIGDWRNPPPGDIVLHSTP